MGIFDFFIKKWTGSSQSATAMVDFTHKRYHARYIINERDLCTVEHARHGLFRVIDLSHHGCLIEPVADSSLDQCVVPTVIDLSVCGSSIRLEVSQCQRRKNGWGMVFKHVHENSIRSLSAIIEPIRCGSTAIAMPSDIGKDGIMSKFRRRFQGDGPFDLVFEKNESGKLIFMMATMRRATEYGSVIWENGNVLTKKSIDHNGEGARMSQTPEVDRSLVWACAAGCIGMKFSEGAQCAKALNEWLSTESQRVSISKIS